MSIVFREFAFGDTTYWNGVYGYRKLLAAQQQIIEDLVEDIVWMWLE